MKEEEKLRNIYRRKGEKSYQTIERVAVILASRQEITQLKGEYSLIFKDIKHNDRKVYTGYFNDGSVQTFHDFNWSATSIITGKDYNYPAHCRWIWEEDKIISTTCYVDPAAIFEEAGIYAESLKEE